MIIILEGMSTVGKTMVQNALADILKEKQVKYKIVEQNEGLPPETFEHLNPKKSLEFLHKYLKENCQDPEMIYIFDRFHLSHLAITNGLVEDIAQIEQELLKYNPILVLLIMNEEEINDRLQGAIKYRGDRWVKELEKRVTNERTATDFHAGTQRKHIKQYELSRLPKVIFNTTDSNFSEIAQEIFDKYIKAV